jgi:hypothetical protein
MSKKILISCRPKCGSTMVWNWFRLLPESKAFYEPTNPILKQLIQTDPKPNLEHRHHHVESWISEYQGLVEFDNLFRSYFGRIDLFLPANSPSIELEKFFKYLFTFPSELLIIKDLNMLFRIDWLKNMFPDLEIVYLRRSPRILWKSTLRVIEEAYCDFKKRPNYGDKSLTAYQNDLESYFPFLTDSFCPHPYYRFYFVCRLADLFNLPTAQVVLDYDHLVREPETTLKSMFTKLEIEVDVNWLLRQAPVIPSPTIIKEEMEPGLTFEKVENDCEAILEKFGFGSEFNPKDFEKIRNKNNLYQTHKVNPLTGLKKQLMSIYEESCERWSMVHEKEEEIQALKIVCDERLDAIKKLSQ